MDSSTPRQLGRTRASYPLRRLVRAALATPAGRRLRTSSALPLNWRSSLKVARILLYGYGHLKSASLGQSVDAAGEPVPWYTYPAIEYLKQLDFSGASLFEYGSGNSTLWWSRRVRSVVAVEHDREWHGQVARLAPQNCTVLFHASAEAYANAIHDYPDGFDLIVVDGLVPGRTRLRCARAALERLRPGGAIILDNSDWLPESSFALRESGLLEVDMIGFCPINDYTSTTSIYFDRAFRFQPVTERQPAHDIGARPYTWESRAARHNLEYSEPATPKAPEPVS